VSKLWSETCWNPDLIIILVLCLFLTRYFDENTLVEVLEAFKPLICPSTCKMVQCLDMLKLFLPYFNPKTVPEFNKFLEFLIEIYNTWNNSPAWEWVRLDLLS